jgi:hypothetical protein
MEQGCYCSTTAAAAEHASSTLSVALACKRGTDSTRTDADFRPFCVLSPGQPFWVLVKGFSTGFKHRVWVEI